MAALSDDWFVVLSPVLADAGLELLDVEFASRRVLVTVDRDGGVDLDALADANRAVSAVLDAREPYDGRYTLEVSSPGLERRLRLPRHFARAVGEKVSVRTLPGTEVRRVEGQLVSSDDDGFVLEGDEVPGGSLRIAYDQVERARTVFDWGADTGGPQPKKGKAPAKGASSAKGRAPATGGPRPGRPKGRRRPVRCSRSVSCFSRKSR